MLLGALVAVAALLTGCEGVPYVLQLAEGQLQIQGNVQPIDEVLASGQLSDDDTAKLQLIVTVRDYAGDTIGLNVGDSYSTYYDTGGDPLAWNLTAARKDALEPKTWTFPIVGTVPYLAFFDPNYMYDYERQLQDKGLDTMTYELDAYSTLGLFADPVRSTMLKRGTLSIVETIIHELLHNTVYRSGDTIFNESLATFVGRQGAIDFLWAQFGEDSGWPMVAVRFYADMDKVNAFLMQFYNDLDAYYGQPLTSQEKIDGREAVFQAARDQFVTAVQPTLFYPGSFSAYATLPTNNTWVLANYRYNLDLSVFAQVYAFTGHDWPATLAVYKAAAAASGDPFAYLRQWVTDHPIVVFTQ